MSKCLTSQPVGSNSHEGVNLLWAVISDVCFQGKDNPKTSNGWGPLFGTQLSMAVTRGSSEGMSVASGEMHSQGADVVPAKAQAFSKSRVCRLLDGKWIY